MFVFTDAKVDLDRPDGRLVSATGVNQIYTRVIDTLLVQGKTVPSRIEDTLELHPAYLEIKAPWRRLVTAYGRPVNVPFMLAEVLWIMAGRKDVEFLSWYNSNIASYSDNGTTFNAAYGHRMIYNFGHNQLDDVVHTLQEDPDSRQCTIVLSDPAKDRGWDEDYDIDTMSLVTSKHETKDRACNVLSHVMIRDGKLDWMQVLRSNDAAWGTPYNFMQWLHIMEITASRIGVPLGTYSHVADSLHLYKKHHEEARGIQHFDLYAELDMDHSATGPLSQEMLDAILSWESAIRRGDEEELNFPAESGSLYWYQVCRILHAWAFYKNYEQDACLRNLTDPRSDKVLAAATARFFWHNRWSKQDSNWAMEARMRAVWPARVVDWVTA